MELVGAKPEASLIRPAQTPFSIRSSTPKRLRAAAYPV